MCSLRTNTSASHPAGPAPPSRPAVRRPTRPARGVSAFWIRQINRLSTSCQPVVVFLHRFTWDFACSCFWGDIQKTCLRFLGEYERRWTNISPGRTVLSASVPARLRPYAPPCASTRTAHGMYGFWNRQVVQDRCVRCFEGEVGLSSMRTELSASRSARPCLAPPRRRAPPRSEPPVLCSGFGLDKSKRGRSFILRGV